MFMNSSKMIILSILIMSTIFIMSNNSWIISWMYMEINLFSFISLLANKNSFDSESLMKYFFVQTICSLNLFLMILILWNWIHQKNLIFSLLNLCILMKMGSAPLHHWYIQIVESLSWLNLFLISTWQKIMPLIMLTYNFNLNILIFSIYLNTLIGAIGGINQTSLRKILGFSSINHIGWMLCCLIINDNMVNFYLIYYTLTMILISMMFYMWNINYMNQMYYFNNFKLNILLFMMIFFSLGGLPPFFGFIPKWMIINFMLLNNMIIMMMFMIFMSLIVLYFYFNIMYQSILMNKFKMKWFIEFKTNYYNYMIFMFTFLMLFMTIIMFFIYFF
uniref:NADH dehydrogenase subunit 2 n=1 Tax=Eoneureclipsis hainanensis TaxID=3043990 RepID=UPI002551F04A|nr:NADH dehydrogenase subunit 2 [Eoneureclipsis hainanensis]WGT74382.1 NADH dehydrogenase subunit 2 [Eoneureclipsis hainanensis]